MDTDVTDVVGSLSRIIDDSAGDRRTLLEKLSIFIVNRDHAVFTHAYSLGGNDERSNITNQTRATEQPTNSGPGGSKIDSDGITSNAPNAAANSTDGQRQTGGTVGEATEH